MATLVARADRLQRRHRALAFPWAVVRKYLDDDGARHAALITYYGFLSLFPLLLLGVAVVSQVLARDKDLQDQLIEAIVPPALQDSVTFTLPPTPVAFVAGAIGLLYSATGVVFATYRTVNHVAAVRIRDLPGPGGAYLRVVVALLLALAGVLAAGALVVAASALPGQSLPDRLLAALGTGGSGFLVLLFGSRVLLVRRTTLRELWPAAAGGAAVLATVLHVAAPLLARLVRSAGPVYGTFATVAGLFTLLYLISQALVLIAEIVAVRHARLWPRALDPADPADADGRALALLAREQERIPGQTVTSLIRRA